jgi:hypothetical protein
MAFGGVYKGVRFRSLLELSVIRHLESEGLILGETMLYEATKIPYGKTRIRSYVVDLTLPQNKLLIEVKPASRAENRNSRTKRDAAEAWAKANGWDYVIITEEELLQCGQLLSLDDVRSIPEVQLGERAMRAIRRRERRKAKKK